MVGKDFDTLNLENEPGFLLYAASKETIRRCNPLLATLDLTYTQYITLLVLWDQPNISVKALGDMLYLDSGTMTPVLKKLEAKGYITRTRSTLDERSVCIGLTEDGIALKEQVETLQPGGYFPLKAKETAQLNTLLRKLLAALQK